MAGSSLLLGGMAAYENLEFWWDGRAAVMVGNDPDLERAAKVQQFDAMRADVSYQTDTGTIQVADKYLPSELVRRLSQGGSIPIRYLESDPDTIEYAGNRLPNPWIWLIVGVVALVFAVIAWRKLRQEFRGE
ncbi:hypothetical protein C7S18_06665 [Ahniella affigens]|uniref:DUF3592 domain-containing protein n=1 Tax=Ahniella affigens TaxID=2021234 RepID=A0A2P1PPY0_9GAMM|nr:hypothetical protein [Ahniella affigens]AVP96901.1 hypothetical protein C7S18_06665 [Ahniella affigens]